MELDCTLTILAWREEVAYPSTLDSYQPTPLVWSCIKRRTDLVTDIATRAVMLLVRVLNHPRSTFRSVIIGHRTLGSLVDLLERTESITVEVRIGSYWSLIDIDINLYDLVL